MFKLMIVTVPIAVLLFAGAWAQETDPGREIADQWAAEQALRIEQQARLDTLMVTMAKEMAEIRSTTDRREKESLMVVHRENMREAMSLMRGMGGMHMRKVMSEHLGSGTKPGMGSGMPEHGHKRMNPSLPQADPSNEQRVTDLENRMDMMHVMMESMIEAEAVH